MGVDANQVAMNAVLCVISGVRPKDEIEAMLEGSYGSHKYSLA